MKNLKIIDYNNTKVVTSTQIAEFLDLEIRSVDRLISKHCNKIAKYGEVRFEITPSNKKVYYLNENQALFLGTLSKNTDLVIEFKQAIVSAYSEAKQPKQLPILDLLKLATQELEKKEAEIKNLAQDNTTLASRQLEVKTQKEYKWKSKEIQNDRGRTINYYVTKHFFDGDYRTAHQKAKQVYRQATGVMLPHRASLMSQEQKLDYLQFLSRL